MYHHNAPYPAGYQSVPALMRPPTHPPPLTIPSPQHQYPQYAMTSSPASSMQMRQQPPVPSSPSESTDQGQEPEYFNLAGPQPTSHIWGQYIWALQVVQNPQRARMCGFGDKDRRPISPPPCVRLVILDRYSKQEVDYNEIDLTHLVLTVDIWDLTAEREMNLVKQSTASPCISSAATGAYPTTTSREAPGHEAPRTVDINTIPVYPPAQYNPPGTPTNLASYYPPGPQGFQPRPTPYLNGQNGQPPAYQNSMAPYARQPFAYPDPRFGPPQNQTPQAQFPPQLPPLSSMSAMEHTYVHQPPANTQQYTRNLIGSLCASAFRLRDDKDNWGIWFVLQDLSVRTEGWFRLKMNFFNISQAIQKSISDATNGTPSSAGSSRPKKETAPCLAATFSNPFKVYSAKKFPGVVESTPLSKAFANQGIKIPIRKDTGGKRGRDDSDDEASGED